MASPAAPQLADRRKRTKLSPENSLEPSVSRKSESTAKASNAPAKPTDASDLNSDNESSELSESSEEPSDFSSSEGEDDGTQMDADKTSKEPDVVNLRANRGKKPTYKLDEQELGPDIRTFLKDFLPQLKAANEELEAQRKDGTLKKREIDAVDGEEDEQYIEMNLGLGVLKMKDAENSSESSSGSDSDSDMNDAEDTAKEKDVLGKLMGQEKTKEAAGIQEVNEKQGA
ncbi:uncharacterized protein EKO05_0005397 [Ascochyta rabiei]|uniref:Uncharacterized protein n=1 Tax=Didymella rabiei TaxID=5454 RepID=A0A163JSA1_DIDRA|nr:uncharacterized protein EKO05_0005397 [Ascochyta rabiei]KZM26558.1 hypothetical protein ST47_g2257 [Ascochyta rabiei]UPX14926.1 hypothetical protein EKO05_0005397 [Ascochyta rabiei]